MSFCDKITSESYLTEEEKNRSAEEWKKELKKKKSTFFVMGLFCGAAFLIFIIAYAFLN